MNYKKKRIIKSLFLSSIIGLFILMLILINQKPDYIQNCEDIKSADINKKVIIKGEIKNEQIYSGREIISLTSCEIPIIIFSRKVLIFPEDKEIEIKGKIERYNNKLQIIAEKVSY